MCNGEYASLQRSKHIDGIIKKDELTAPKDIKILLVGTAESGKSTILKQIRILYKSGFTDNERKQCSFPVADERISFCFNQINKYKLVIYSNTIQSLAAILRAMHKLSIPFKSAEPLLENAKLVMDVVSRNDDTEPFDEELLHAMDRLWKDAGVQECFNRSNEYKLYDSACCIFEDANLINKN